MCTHRVLAERIAETLSDHDLDAFGRPRPKRARRPALPRLLITGGRIDDRLAGGGVELIRRLRAPGEILRNGRRKQNEYPRNPDRYRRHHDKVAGRQRTRPSDS